jgi:hypothetical protein
MFTDYYGEQSCTAGRALLHHRPVPCSAPACPRWACPAPRACRTEDPDHRRLLKALGYATGQFGKNHLGDRDEHLPTNHGFDEFFGNLYHLNAEEEPENEDYPGDLNCQRQDLPRAVRPARRDPLLGVAGRHAEDRGHRAADQEAHGDGRRRDLAAAIASSRSRPRPASPGSSGGTARACTFAPTSRTNKLRGHPGQTNTPTAWSSTTCTSASSWTCSTSWASPTTPSCSTPPTTARTTTPGRMRRHALPRREEHQLGGRLARAGHGALARQDPGR